MWVQNLLQLSAVISCSILICHNFTKLEHSSVTGVEIIKDV